MDWKTELEARIAGSIFTRYGVIDINHVAVRRFDTSLLPEPGWRFSKGDGKGWSDEFESKAHARASLALHLTREEDMLVRALAGFAGFTHTGWLEAHRSVPPCRGNEGLGGGYYRMCGDHIHVIRYHDGFLGAFAVKMNRIARIPLPEITDALKRSDRFMILKLDGVSIAQTILLSPGDPVEILPCDVEEDGLFGVTARSVRDAIGLLDAMGHENNEDDE